MNSKLVESYIKDQLRKQYRKNNVFCENGIIYIGSAVEVYFFENDIAVYGYKTLMQINLQYPQKDGYLEETLEQLVSVIIAFVNLETAFSLYKEVI